MLPSWDQISGAVDRVILIVLAFVVAKWGAKIGLTSDDAKTLGGALVLVVGVFYGGYVNRRTALATSAANIPGTTVVTTPDVANAVPATNVMSSAVVKVVGK